MGQPHQLRSDLAPPEPASGSSGSVSPFSRAPLPRGDRPKVWPGREPLTTVTGKLNLVLAQHLS
jgi:hypothetical protein